LCQFHQIYSLGAFGDKDKLSKFWGPEIKCQSHSEVTGRGMPIDNSPSKTI